MPPPATNGDKGAKEPSGGETVGREMYALVQELYPICRSITGNGVRKTLEILSRHAPVVVHEVPSGTSVLDWVVPKEWNISDAWIKNERGIRVVDFRATNLHVVNYSVPFRARLSLENLRPHLHSLPDHPDLIPYKTSYYVEDWGFCLSQRQLDALPPGEYDVCIESTLEPGALTYGEIVLPGELPDEILLSAHVCHPSLCDDNLTGLAIAVFLARAMSAKTPRRYTMRFLFAPGTIGAITWLAQNETRVHRIRHGLTLTCLGDNHCFTYKRTVKGTAEIDRVAAHVLRTSGMEHELVDFFPYGYDERQFNSPGFRIPVGSLMRGRHGRFPEYHTSGDNLSFVSAERMTQSFQVCAEIVNVLQHNAIFRNLVPRGEPQLGRRGLYRAMGGNNIPQLELAMLWVLNLSDGGHMLLDVADRAGMEFGVVRAAADLLLQHGLLEELVHPAEAKNP
jgi:aminopeptidase-like protein